MRMKDHLTSALIGYGSLCGGMILSCWGAAHFGPAGYLLGFVAANLAFTGEKSRFEPGQMLSFPPFMVGATLGMLSGLSAYQVSVNTFYSQPDQLPANNPSAQTVPADTSPPVLERGMSIQEAARTLGLKPPAHGYTPRPTPPRAPAVR